MFDKVTLYFSDNIYFFSLLLLGLMLLNQKIVDLIFLTFMGTIGIFLSVLGLFSEHQEILWNYNILCFNPLLILLVFALVKSKKWSQKVVLIYSICFGIYLLISITKSGFLTLLPLSLSTVYLVFRNFRKRS